MKKIFRYSLLLVFSLIVTNQILGNLNFDNQIYNIIKVGFVLALFEIILKPTLKLLLLPINLLTLGSFRIVIDTLGLYLAVILINGFHVSKIFISSFNLFNYTIPTLKFSGFMAFLVTSFIIGLTYHIFSLILYNKK